MELSVSSETTFFNMKLQLEICPQLRTGSSAEDTGRIDTRSLVNMIIHTFVYTIYVGFYNLVIASNQLKPKEKILHFKSTEQKSFNCPNLPALFFAEILSLCDHFCSSSHFLFIGSLSIRSQYKSRNVFTKTNSFHTCIFSFVFIPCRIIILFT